MGTVPPLSLPLLGQQVEGLRDHEGVHRVAASAQRDGALHDRDAVPGRGGPRDGPLVLAHLHDHEVASARQPRHYLNSPYFFATRSSAAARRFSALMTAFWSCSGVS